MKCWKYWISILNFRHQDNFRYISDIEILEILDFNIEFQTRSGPGSEWPPHTTEEQVEAVQGWESTQQKSQEEENGGHLKNHNKSDNLLEFSCWFFFVNCHWCNQVYDMSSYVAVAGTPQVDNSGIKMVFGKLVICILIENYW